MQKETGVVAMVDHVRRFNPSHQWVHNRIAAGELHRRGEVSSEVRDRVVEDPEPAWGVVEALQTLSPQQRAVVVLRDYVGHSGRATAEMLGTTEASVRVQLSRARRALRKELER